MTLLYVIFTLIRQFVFFNSPAVPHFSRAFIRSIYSRKKTTNIPVKRLRRPVIIIVFFILEFEGCLVIDSGPIVPVVTFILWGFIPSNVRFPSLLISFHSETVVGLL